jgi:O-antigen/teichoic acid export membrane protein
MFVLSVTALALSTLGAHRELVAITWALSGTIPFILMREFARRFAFAHFKMFQVLTVDLAVAVLNGTMLGALGWTGQLSAVTALGAVGFSCAIGAIGWLYLVRTEFAFRLGQVRGTLKQSWVLGKWFFSCQLALQTQGYMTFWLSMVIAGATVTGIYTACMSIVAFANPLLYGFLNILTPRSVRALRTEGGAGLRRQAAWDSLLLAVVMTAFCVIVLLVGEDVMQHLYPGLEYKGNGHILTVLAFAALAAAIGAPASNALASAGHARAVAGMVTVTAVLSVILIFWLMTNWGLLGAAYGVLIAEVVGSLERWIAFLQLVPEFGRPQPEPDRYSQTQTVRQNTSSLE